jgi:hypothetical protein
MGYCFGFGICWAENLYRQIVPAGFTQLLQIASSLRFCGLGVDCWPVAQPYNMHMFLQPLPRLAYNKTVSDHIAANPFGK